jgi:membrane fusion protein (multidrug efflux system)
MPSRRWIIVIALCLGLFLALAAFKAMQISAAIAFGKSFPEPSETVEWITAETKTYPQILSAPGELMAVQSLLLRNEIEGTIVVINFASGEQVKKGQLLLQLDTREEQAQLQAAQAQAELSRLSLQRFQQLIKTNASSKDQYDQAAAEYAIANANVHALEARISKKTIKAPFAALAGLHQLEVGQFLSGNTPITQLTGIGNNIWVDFYLPQQQANLPIGTEVLLTAQGIFAEPVSGKIIASDSAISKSSRNRQFRAVVSNKNHLLSPGLAVNVSIANPPPTPAIIVPAMAVRYDSTGKFVYVIETVKSEPDTPPKVQQRAWKRNVIAGTEFSGQVVIIDGIKAGEIIAVNGSYKLRDGMLVNMQPALSTGNGKAP